LLPVTGLHQCVLRPGPRQEELEQRCQAAVLDLSRKNAGVVRA
jgi:hypothetical protein